MKAIPFVRCRSGWKPLRAAALSLMVTAAARNGFQPERQRTKGMAFMEMLR